MTHLISDATYFAARRTSVRDRSAPVVSTGFMAGHLPDPRPSAEEAAASLPFDPRLEPFRIIAQLPRLAACLLVIAIVWRVLL
jgi:hypothetical protein